MKRVMHIGDEVFVHGYIDEIRNDTIIIRNVGGYFGTSRDEVFYYEEDERGYGTMNEADRKTENSSENPNNCEHITEDGVTCAKYPACDDCLDNPLNKVKGSERLLKGKTEPTISKMEQVDKDINVRSKDEPQTSCNTCRFGEVDEGYVRCAYYSKATEQTEPQTSGTPYEIETSSVCKTEPQTDCAWQNDEYIPTDLASTMLKNRFKEKK